MGPWWPTRGAGGVMGLFVPVALFLATASYAAAEDFGWHEVVPDRVNLREHAGTHWAATGRLRSGQLVYVRKIDDGWAQVDIDDDGWTDGWVRFDLLAEVDDPEFFDPGPGNGDAPISEDALGTVILAVAAAYMLPFLIALTRGHHNKTAIFALNVLLGWTFIGWAVAFVWSLTAIDPARKRAVGG